MSSVIRSTKTTQTILSRSSREQKKHIYSHQQQQQENQSSPTKQKHDQVSSSAFVCCDHIMSLASILKSPTSPSTQRDDESPISSPPLKAVALGKQLHQLQQQAKHDEDVAVTKLSKEDVESCTRLLKECEMFHKVPQELLAKVVKEMTVRHVQNNEKFVQQGEECDRFYLLEEGEIVRKHYDENTGKKQTVRFVIKASSLNTMRVLSGDCYHDTINCVTEGGCRLYQMKRNDFIRLLEHNPALSVHIADGLSAALRNGSKTYVTPLLQQQQQEVNVPAVAIAAGIESYYRSALNAMLNARLTGVRAPQFFPNMHIQVPVRIAYITGFKGLRASLENWVDPDDFTHHNSILKNSTQLRLAMAIAPGVLMTPIASVLEASNAGHMNSEPLLTRRWMRGFFPRMGREIIFGLGLNQLSDYFEERWQPIFSPDEYPSTLGGFITPSYAVPDDSSSSSSSSLDNDGNKKSMFANAAGSLTAGVVAGYFSHIPHNMSTYKLLEPHKSYGELYWNFVKQSVPPWVHEHVKHWSSPHARAVAETVAATVFPRGLVLRTTQIVGSFMILNGTINYLHGVETRKLQSLSASWGSGNN